MNGHVVWRGGGCTGAPGREWELSKTWQMAETIRFIVHIDVWML